MKTEINISEDFKNKLDIELKKVINTSYAELKRKDKAKRSIDKFLKKWYKDNPNSNHS